MSPPSPAPHLRRARDLTKQYQEGGPAAFGAFRELVHLVLSLTIMGAGGGVQVRFGPRGRDRGNLVGWRSEDRVPLMDGRLLRLLIQLFLENGRLKVEKSLFQYQIDEDAERWIFRYDYLRNPEDPHPASHLQIHATLRDTGVVPVRGTLERVHFPTGRIAFEAVIRLLVEQFGVPTQEPPEVWRPVLAETEAAFLRIARRPLSGPRK